MSETRVRLLWRADAVVSAAVRRKIEEQQAREAAAEAAPDMSGAQAAALKRQIAGLLQPGETVTEALKRLRPPAPKPARRGGPLAAMLFISALAHSHPVLPRKVAQRRSIVQRPKREDFIGAKKTYSSWCNGSMSKHNEWPHVRMRRHTAALLPNPQG